MVSKENKARGWRTLLGGAAIASVVVSFGAATPAKAHDDDDDDYHGGYHQGWDRDDRHEDREEAHEAWERHEWAEAHPYGYGYYAQPRAYYYAQPRAYYPPPVYYAPQPYAWGGLNINIPIR